MYQDIDGKMMMGPVWDFDIGLGVVGQGHEDGSYAKDEENRTALMYAKTAEQTTVLRFLILDFLLMLINHQ